MLSGHREANMCLDVRSNALPVVALLVQVSQESESEFRHRVDVRHKCTAQAVSLGMYSLNEKHYVASIYLGFANTRNSPCA